jgi:hypothetical protein
VQSLEEPALSRKMLPVGLALIDDVEERLALKAVVESRRQHISLNVTLCHIYFDHQAMYQDLW